MGRDGDMLDAAERVAVLIEAAAAGLSPWDVVLISDELHDILVRLDALPPDLVLALERLGLA